MEDEEELERADADDECDDDDDAADDSSSAQEAIDDEDEEPRLKYKRLGGSVPSLLSSDTASCISVAERMIALGTHGGRVHLLDYQGNQVKEFAAHTATVNELSFDSAGEFVGSCSDDGSVVVSSLYTDSHEKFHYHRPMKAVALDPDYCKTNRFAGGGLAGHLILNSKGWFGPKDQVLHSGEGPIHAVKWRTSLIAWANDEGVKLFDTASQQRLTFIEKPKNSPDAEYLRPHLVWQDDVHLLVGWGNCIKIAALRVRGADLPGGLNSETFSFGKRFNLLPGTKYVEIVSVLQTEYFICGLAPYGGALVVLAYIEREGSKTESATGYSPKQTGHAQRPEVCILNWKNEELATDALSMHGYEHYKAKDYELAHAPFSGSSTAGGQWAAGYEPLYYIVSPKDVVVARQRDADDHVQWLLKHGWHEKALEAVEAGNARVELLDEVGAQYLDHLILGREYALAASLCPKILRGSVEAWERRVFHFGQLRQLHVLAPYIPVVNPQLRDTVYEVVLDRLLVNPAHHEQFLELVRSWPQHIYSVPTIISAAEIQCSTGGKTPFLLEALAILYLSQRQLENVLNLYLELQKPAAFDIIEEHHLYDALHGNIALLMKLDSKRAIDLLVQQRDRISASEVVSSLENLPQEQSRRRLLHDYLHTLFERDTNAGRKYHDLQVELYAEFEPRLLLPFLRSSQYYSLNKAYDVCTRLNLAREKVYLLGQMGNAKEALALIINELKSMQAAVEFVTSRNDDDLWNELINQSLHNPDMIGALLDHTVGNIDPMQVINRIPKDMPVPRLRDRLVKVITDYKTETSLRGGCNNILKADRRDLQLKRYSSSRTAVVAGKSPCCICSDLLASQRVAVVTFFCGHFYHVTCLQDSSVATSPGRSPGSDEEQSERCILCTEGSHKKQQQQQSNKPQAANGSATSITSTPNANFLG
ncbi:vacuolar protein sorting-associated protein 41 homolog [Selaginella moellendorffii]|uniref:vacuolar protein sorting-associated protein 41 homolog n=1 Tax=Selaginella moellendorffii TaxID=88036 RepID=UPI000D1C2973|nr:vacuolar protein sorting-associated protein 41 homolog [Selaginella moellendorffii]|eukprot:XP_024534538.1 vacuolar protein sorting-associated protein 41 homolog [Selaginella moellendorffii]